MVTLKFTRFFIKGIIIIIIILIEEVLALAIYFIWPLEYLINPSAWGYLNPSQYCDVGRFFYGVFKF